MQINLKSFFDQLRGAFSQTRRLKQEQVEGIDFLVPQLAADKSLVIEDMAYILGTAAHETAWTFQPIKEYGGQARFERLYDPIKANTAKRRQRARRMGNTEYGDGAKYCGRGYVQLTWKNNYLRAGNEIDVDLVGNPDLAMVPEIAYQIMVKGMQQGWFTGKRLSQYINPPKVDFVRARYIINGRDRRDLIAGYADQFLKMLRNSTTQPEVSQIMLAQGDE